MTRRMFLRFFAGACLACGGLGGGGYAFLRKNMFGALPAGGLEKTLMRSPHYYNGEFHNLAERAVLKDDGSVLFLFSAICLKKGKSFSRKSGSGQYPCFREFEPCPRLLGLAGAFFVLSAMFRKKVFD